MSRARGSTARVGVLSWGAGAARKRSDRVATEEPLEIRLVQGPPRDRVSRPVSVTMRTPGRDVELAVGFLFAEGIVIARECVREVRHCPGRGEQRFNVVEVLVDPAYVIDEALLERNFYTTSSCGVCGKASLEVVERRGCTAVPEDGFLLPAALVARLPEKLREAQTLFARTGGLHAAGLFDGEGTLLLAREDVGRHNAVDKVVGARFLSGDLPLARTVLAVSGRASFEIVQKAVAARVPVVVAVGAPSSLAVDLARRFQLTLVGFAREGRFNVYSGEGRIS